MFIAFFLIARKCQNCRIQYLGNEGIELWISGYKAAMPVAVFNVNSIVLKLAGCAVKLREMNSRTVGELKREVIWSSRSVSMSHSPCIAVVFE
jgi:hypothetical protein